MVVVLHQAWSENQWSVMLGYLIISTNITDAIKHVAGDSFVLEQDSERNTFKLLQRETLNYLSLDEPMTCTCVTCYIKYQSINQSTAETHS